ncbi:MAG: ABC transporter permease, partial [Lachnospiraceae bacterium]|nr:ABC transporter permease [Lachnospiraceae bacterium]
MKSYHTLARKEILEQKIVSALILAAIILSTMMTAAVGQSVVVLSAMRKQQAIAIGGDRYATFVQLTEEQAQFLERDERLSYAGRSVTLGSMELNDLLYLDLAEYWDGGIEMRPAHARLVGGRLPEGPMEIALSEDALQFLGFTGEIGDTIPLSLSKALRHGVQIEAYDYQAEFVLTGITESNYMGYTNGRILGFVGEGTAAAVLPSEYLYYNVDVKTADKKHFQSVMNDIGSTLNLHELDTTYNFPYLKALGIRYAKEEDDSVSDEGFSYLFLVGALVVVLVLTAAGLVIYNILKIAVARRVKGYGVLRAIGAEKGQLYGLVAKEVLLLCAIGIPTGLLLGALSAKGILTAAVNQLSTELFLAQYIGQHQALMA